MSKKCKHKEYVIMCKHCYNSIFIGFKKHKKTLSKFKKLKKKKKRERLEAVKRFFNVDEFV